MTTTTPACALKSCRRNFTAEDLRISIAESAEKFGEHLSGLKTDMLGVKNDVKVMKDAYEQLKDALGDHQMKHAQKNHRSKQKQILREIVTKRQKK